MKREYIPITERGPKHKNFDQEMQARRSANKANKKESEDLEECTFQPNTSRKPPRDFSGNYRGTQSARNIQNLFRWEKEKKERLAVKIMEKQSRAEINTFRPSISKNSKKMVHDRRSKSPLGGIPLHERLQLAATRKEKKLKQMRKEQEKGLFKPKMSEKSKQILRQKGTTETLFKRDNGVFNDVEYYEAVPKRTSSPARASVERRSRSRKRGVSRSSSRGAIAAGRKKGVFTGKKTKVANSYQNLSFKQNKSDKKRLKRDPYPAYYSPYSSEVMNSDMPLKKILKHSEAHRSNLKKTKAFGAPKSPRSGYTKTPRKRKLSSNISGQSKSRSKRRKKTGLDFYKNDMPLKRRKKARKMKEYKLKGDEEKRKAEEKKSKAAKKKEYGKMVLERNKRSVSRQRTRKQKMLTASVSAANGGGGTNYSTQVESSYDVKSERVLSEKLGGDGKAGGDGQGYYKTGGDFDTLIRSQAAE